MPPLMQLPAYQATQVDPGNFFEPIGNALMQYRKGMDERAKHRLDRDQYDLHAREVNQKLDRQQRADEEWRAIPESEFANVPGGRFIRMAGSEHGPQLATNALYHFKNSDIQRKLIEAQAEQARAHAYLYREMAKARGGVPQQQVDPTAGYGLEDGKLVPLDGPPAPRASMPPSPLDYFRQGGPRVESQVLGREQSSPGTTTREHADYGPSGTVTTDVPGLVVTPKGTASKYGTEQYAGQRAIDQMPDARRARLLQFMRNNEAWSAAHGKRGVYDEYGRPMNLGPKKKWEAESEASDRRIDDQMMRVNDALKTMTEASGIARAVVPGLSDSTAGRIINNATGNEDLAQAYIDYEEAIMVPLYTLSGKNITNKETERFLKLWMPRAGESVDLIKKKHARLTTFMKALQSEKQRGVIDEDGSVSMDGIRRAMTAEPPKQGAGGQSTPQPSANPAQDRLKSKYGLE